MFPGFSSDNCRSSIFEKLDPDLRRQVDFAILEMELFPTLRSVWLHYELGKKGVSYSAMYRYARHLRDRANRAEMAQIVADPELDLTEKVGTVITQCVLQKVLDNDEIDPRDLKRLASTLRLTSKMGIEKRHLSERHRLAWARLELDNKTHQLNTEKLDLFRNRFVDRPDHERQPSTMRASHAITADHLNGHPRTALTVAKDPNLTQLCVASERRGSD